MIEATLYMYVIDHRRALDIGQECVVFQKRGCWVWPFRSGVAGLLDVQ